MHPDELLEKLKVSATPRKKKNLDIIHTVCREQYTLGNKDFSVATISRLAQKQGGPVASTIHNKTGLDFKSLIKAWAENTEGQTRKPRKSKEHPINTILDKIDNLPVRAIMGAVLAENSKLKREVNLLKANAGIVIDFRPTEPTSEINQPIQILPASADLSDSEKEALRHAISNTLLQDEGWTQDEHGRVLNNKSRPIFKVGFVSGIKKIVG
ncbi:hypothetical protein K4H28_08485 [Deefgea tanakiae]|uniref:Alpha/beta hydrolase n=1 Tax=Deefgea tanakiae TaxID=2865840 RepID=A0ABX8Z5V3_9NEIS|nr:gamma-mobile-trio protein GmtX [Deefgea tanakiae]QZA76388.1 hypothetical protein K4H28_08485 [Deefgea tanakiae]